MSAPTLFCRSASLAFALLVSACAAPDDSTGIASPAAVTGKATTTATTRSTARFAEDMVKLGDALPYGAFVHFSSGTPAEHRALMAERDLKIGYDFEENAQALYVIGKVSAFKALSGHPMVAYLEDNNPLELMDDTDGWATRVRVAQEPVSGGPYYDMAGNIVRGQGVGVAVVDSGFRGDHPDFASNLVRNYRINCPVPTADEANIAMCQFTDLGKTGSSEVAGGHGTHCAGIAVGDGSASTGLYPVAGATPNTKGTYTGVAPGAKLYGFGAGAGTQILLLNAAAGFDKVIKDNASGANIPKVRVISNSYGGDGAYNPDAVVSKLTNRAIDAGISVVFAAGNDGEAEAATAADPSKTGASCRNPKPGMICVASYNDEGTGRRDASLSGFSSRAEVSKLSEYPDIAAPGDLITAVCSQGDPGQAVCSTGAETRWQPQYGTISGTSMATPHVAGIIALMYQVKPELTPAQVEKLIKDNAIKLASNGPYVNDPSNPGGTINRGFGAGLIDLPTLLDKLGAIKGTPPAAGTQLIADGDSETQLAGAADIVRLTMTEKNEGGQNGIVFALTVRDASLFGTPAASQVRLAVAMNADGKRFTTGAILKPDGSVAVVPSGPNASAAATSAVKTGNVVEFFVPLGAIGGPAVGAPIHNIMAISYSTSGAGESTVDYTPSATDNATLAALRPVFGRPYTVLSSSSPVSENICVAPGATVLTDTTGDLLTGTQGSASGGALDAESLGVSQPHYANGSYKLVFTLKMSSLTAVPQGTTWPINFCAPALASCTGVSAYSASNQYFTVRMTTDPAVKISPAGSAPEFQVLTATAANATAASRAVKLADAESKFNADGTITIVVNAADIGLSAADAGKPAQALSMFLVRISNSSGTTPDNMPNAATQGAGAYATRPVAFCSPNRLPVPILTVDAPSKTRGMEFVFNAETSSDPDAGDTITRYEFDFGDQSPPVAGSSPIARHTYANSGAYSVSLKVTDSKGAVSTTPATLGVNVTNRLPIAVLASDKTSGTTPLTVAFDAGASSDPDSNDTVTSYSFDLDGDGSFEIIDGTKSTFSKTYDTAGTYAVKLKVKDSEGLESAVATQTITVNATTPANTAPTARLLADKTSGATGVTVGFDATTSSDADANDAVVSYSFDLDGDGTYEIIDSANGKPGHTYNTAGNYTVKVKAKDKLGLESLPATVGVTITPPPNTAPSARLTADKTSGLAPLTENFDALASSDADAGDAVASYSFDLDGDGSYEIIDSSSATASHRYETAGTVTASVQVRDLSGQESAPASIEITVIEQGLSNGNRRPVAQLNAPSSGMSAQAPINFDGIASYDPDSNDGVQSLSFDFGDGTPVLTVEAGVVQHRYAVEGSYTVTLVVTDTRGARSTPVTRQLVVGKAADAPASTPVATGSADGTVTDDVRSGSGAASPALLVVLGLLALGRHRRRRQR